MRQDFALARSLLDSPPVADPTHAEGTAEPAQMELFG
jgi:hypothetical protein